MSDHEAMVEEIGDYARIRTDYLIEDLLSDYEGLKISKSVHVEAGCTDRDPVAETAWVQGIADEHGFPHGIIVHSDLRSPSLEEELNRHRQYRNVRGVRPTVRDDSFEDPAFRRGARIVAKHGLSLELEASPLRMGSMARLAQDVPGLRLFLEHTGCPLDRSNSYFERWRAAMRDVAAADNVVVKISGLGMRDRRWTFDSIRPWVLEAIEVFGAKRCVVGTNWPVDRLYSGLPTLVNAYRCLLAEFTLDEQESILFRNAELFYDI